MSYVRSVNELSATTANDTLKKKSLTEKNDRQPSSNANTIHNTNCVIFFWAHNIDCVSKIQLCIDLLLKCSGT